MSCGCSSNLTLPIGPRGLQGIQGIQGEQGDAANIGPGTDNYFAIFNTAGTNIENSVVYQSSGNIGINTTTPTSQFDSIADTNSGSYIETSSTTATHEAGLFRRKANANSTDRILAIEKSVTSGTPTTGIAAGLYFRLENDGNTRKDAAAIKAVSTSVIGGSEDTDIQFFYGKTGVLVEGMTLNSSGILQIDGTSAGILIQTTGNSNSLNITNSGTAGITGILSTVYSTDTNASAIVGVRENDTNNVIHDVIIINKTGLLNPTLGANGNGSGIRFDADSTTTNATMGGIAMRWKVATHASRISEFIINTVNNAGAATERFKIDGAGRAYIKTPSSAPTDGDIDNGTITFYLNEGTNELTVRVKYAAGTTKTGVVALV